MLLIILLVTLLFHSRLNYDFTVLTSLPKKKKKNLTIQTAVSLFTYSPYLWYIFYGGD